MNSPLVPIGLLLTLGWSVPAAPGQTDPQPLAASAAAYQAGQSAEALRGLEDLVRRSSTDPALRKELEVALVRLLSPSATLEARRFAAKQLGILGTESALPALAPLLTQEDGVSIACLALTTYPPGAADEVLRTALNTARGPVRVQILNTLGDRRDAKAVRALAAAAGDPDPAVAEAAIIALGKVGDANAWKVLKSFTPRSDALQRVLSEAALRCAEGLGTSGDRQAAMRIYEKLLSPAAPVHVRRGALSAWCRLAPEQSEGRLLKILAGPDAALKPVAIAACPSIPGPKVSARLAALLPKLSPEEQGWLIDALAARGDAEAQTAVWKGLQSPEPVVRRAAITACSSRGDSAAVKPLVASLVQTTDADDRRAIESALIALRGGHDTDQAVLGALQAATGSARVHLLSAYGWRAGSAANPVLLAELGSADPSIAKAALRGLARTAGAEDAAMLLAGITQIRDGEVRAEAETAASQVLARIPDSTRRSMVVLEALARPQVPECRLVLLGLLPVGAGPQALAALQTAVSDADLRFHEAAVRALGEWPDLAAWDPLVGVYTAPRNEALRGVALRGLVRLASDANARPDSRLSARYQQLLSGARGPADLKLILGALSGAHAPESLQLALPLLTNANVRAEAEVTVKKIAEAIQPNHPKAAREALQQVGAKPQ